MAITVDQLSETEQLQIESEINDDLVELFYKGAPTGAVASVFTGVSLFILFYGTVDHFFLISWLSGLLLNTALSVFLYLSYRKFKSKYEPRQWGFALSFLVALYTVYYGSCIFFAPSDSTHRTLLVAILIMLAAGFSTTTVGFFKLCIACVSFILFPLITWLLVHNDSYYNISGIILLIAYVFFLGMNYRSTVWLKDSLRLKLENAHFTHQANHDLLTDLPNQRGLEHLIDATIESVKNTNQKFAIVCFSINRLEVFNNSLGYPAGDLIIQSLAKRFTTLKESSRNLRSIEYTITLPRSDSFSILMTPIDHESIIEEIKRLFLTLDNPFFLGKREAKLTASAGISIYPEDGENGTVLLSNAYAAMFQAKQHGGNQFEFYKKSINEKTPYLLELEYDLHYALPKKQFLVYYQPFIDLKTGKISGMEALIRWKHPTRGLVSPLDFIPLAEDTNLIIPIGEWILEEAARQTMLWQTEEYPLKIAVNLSPKQLRQGNLIETIDNVMKKTGIHPQFLELELTETAILDAAVTPLVKEISKRGISLSIDDFGTGYSGLSYLKHFDIDKIKIDKSFIQDINTNNESATIVSAILAMAKELGIKTLAEGVETKDQLAFLKDRGCRYIQGYYYSKPIPADEFTQLLLSGKYTG